MKKLCILITFLVLMVKPNFSQTPFPFYSLPNDVTIAGAINLGEVESLPVSGLLPGRTMVSWLDTLRFWTGSTWLTLGKGVGIGLETDPVFIASPAYGIDNDDIALWNIGGLSQDSLFERIDLVGSTQTYLSSSYLWAPDGPLYLMGNSTGGNGGTISLSDEKVGIEALGTPLIEFKTDNGHYYFDGLIWRNNTDSLITAAQARALIFTGGGSETDPIFSASLAASITTEDTTRWGAVDNPDNGEYTSLTIKYSEEVTREETLTEWDSMTFGAVRWFGYTYPTIRMSNDGNTHIIRAQDSALVFISTDGFHFTTNSGAHTIYMDNGNINLPAGAQYQINGVSITAGGGSEFDTTSIYQQLLAQQATIDSLKLALSDTVNLLNYFYTITQTDSVIIDKLDSALVDVSTDTTYLYLVLDSLKTRVSILEANINNSTGFDTSFVFTPTQINAGDSVMLLTAPGVDKAYFIEKIRYAYKYETTPYQYTGEPFTSNIVHQTLTDLNYELSYFIRDQYLTHSYSFVGYMNNYTQNEIPIKNNSPIWMDFSNQLHSGDGLLKIYITYRVVDFDDIFLAPEEDATPPVFVLAYVSNAVSDVCVVLVDTNDLHQGMIPDDEDFVLTENSVEVDVTGVIIINDSIKLQLASDITAGTTLELSYTSGLVPLVDSSGNGVANWVNESVTNNVEATPTFNATYQRIYDSLDLKPSETHAAWQNEFVDSLVIKGYWDRIPQLLFLGQEYNTNGEALMDWKLNENATFIGTPVHTPNVGISTDAAGEAINTHFNPSTDGGGVTTLTSTTLIVYNINDISNGDYYDAGCSNGTAQLSLSSGYGGTTYTRINAGTATSFANTNSSGLFGGTRTAESRQELYRGFSTLAETTSGTASRPNLDIYLLARNLNNVVDSRTTNTMFLYLVANGFTDAEWVAVATIIERLADHYGVGVH